MTITECAATTARAFMIAEIGPVQTVLASSAQRHRSRLVQSMEYRLIGVSLRYVSR